MLVLSSPSGAGKTTISRDLLAREPDLSMSVSVTTRAKRPGETPGVDYHFIDPSEFNLRVNRRELLDTPRSSGTITERPQTVEETLAAGRDVLFDIDWARSNWQKNAREDLVSVFALPPLTRELERRLKSRAQDSAEVVSQRMAQAANELSHWAEYDYVIVNNDIAASVGQVQSILQAERLRRERLIGLHEFVKALREGQ
jgi:guanylate kinase